MYGVIGEDTSDVNTLKVLIRSIAEDDSVSIKGKGYDGCAQMLIKGARQLRLFANVGCRRFIVCYDADGPEATARRERVIREVVRPSGVAGPCCVVIPVQELEAWILADIEAVTNVFSSWRPDPILNPEAIPSPKEFLIRISKAANHRPRYSDTAYNEVIAKYLDIAKLRKKCPSFVPLYDFVRN